MTMPPIVGIDLGTTNSLMAYVDYRTGLPRVIPDRRGQVLVPSVVSFRPEGPLVGDEAKRLLAQEPGSTVFSAKRLLGRSYDDAAPELAYLPFAVLPGERTTRLLVGDREITPTEVSAIVLKALKEQAGAHFGEPVRRAVITVPGLLRRVPATGDARRGTDRRVRSDAAAQRADCRGPRLRTSTAAERGHRDL
jgi:molecular chaperone DnaK (HSP70)